MNMRLAIRIILVSIVVAAITLLIIIWLSYIISFYDSCFVANNAKLRLEMIHYKYLMNNKAEWADIVNREEDRYYDEAYILFGITGHRITSGLGTLIGVRHYDERPTFLTSASGVYTKISIYVPYQLKTFGIIDSNEEGVIMFVSKGSSYHPGSGSCIGYPEKGYVKYNSINNTKYLIDLHLEFTMHNTVAIRYKCKPLYIDQKYSMNKTSVNELSPWDGNIVPDRDSIYSEVRTRTYFHKLLF